MIKFIFKAILRDKNRSLLPVIVVALGVFLTIALSGYLSGVLGDMIDQTARFQTGHVKVMSRAYADNVDQMPNDLALLSIDKVHEELNSDFPNYTWVNRINFGGIIDALGENDVSKGQGPAMGMAIELFSQNSGEAERLNLLNSLVEGKIPEKSGEVLIGHEFANKLGVTIGDELTFMGSTMNGSMTFAEFVITGTVRFGVAAMDKGTIIIDFTDAQQILDMPDGAGEILGFRKDEVFIQAQTLEMRDAFNAKYASNPDEFAPIMKALGEQNSMGTYLSLIDSVSSMFVIIFILVMSVVLWNTGLIGGLRRYQEFGIRLALGEDKGHIYKTMIYEAVLIGVIGSVIGTTLGIVVTLLMQKHGIDISGMLKDATMMMPSVMKSKFTPQLFYIGFIPGLLAMVIGTMLSGIGIYKRETATLFKELEV
ncbi:MAG: FtsX-like permease family protein [Bacteroidales bacterium]|nr:FtsX-like permease family protein [Bacteroidales bacterium]MDD4384897.1 FtsX-like permease family protein [Bacteroidales bacterium]